MKTMYMMIQYHISYALNVLYSSGIKVDKVTQTIDSMSGALKNVASPIACLMVVISGIALMTGQQGRQWAKPTMLYTAIGFMVVLLSSNIIESLQASFI